MGIAEARFAIGLKEVHTVSYTCIIAAVGGPQIGPSRVGL